ncbi:hypothetical protein BDQ17DRAFT_1047689 [Cyathus striatus]|nr:hypothetical protein BDQ17DRAFT_1047689 [Cyathus striatus]
MDQIKADLPSMVEEGLAVCPRFCILVVGNTGVGKSSLVSSVFNISLNDTDIAHGREGRANIEFGYTSSDNPRFILHDSQGFAPGSTANWDIVERFIRNRSSVAELKDRIHAIWLCIETPRTGSRLLQTGDEKLLLLAKELNIQILAVFTKFDMLVNEHIRRARRARAPDSGAREMAEKEFENRIQNFKASAQVDCVWISTKPSLSFVGPVIRQCLRAYHI